MYSVALKLFQRRLLSGDRVRLGGGLEGRVGLLVEQQQRSKLSQESFVGFHRFDRGPFFPRRYVCGGCHFPEYNP